MKVNEGVRWAGVGLALFSGLAALAVILLPLVLVLLMLLFDTTAHGVLVLLGLLFEWLRSFMPGNGGAGNGSPGGGTLPAFQTVLVHPLPVALESLARAAPCLAGLVLILLNQAPGRGWWWIVLLWAVAAAAGGEAAALLLLPGLVLASCFAWQGRASRPGKARQKT